MSIRYYKVGINNMMEIKECSGELHSSKEHLHGEMSVGFIEEGETNLTVNGMEYHMKSGEAIVIYPFVPHECRPVDINNWKFTMIYLGKELYEGLVSEESRKCAVSIKKLNHSEFNKVKEVILSIEENTSGYEEGKLENFVSEILENCDINIIKVESELLESIKKYIEENFLDDIKLEDIADNFHINKFLLIRHFKNKYNTTPLAYQIQLRVDYAKHIISEDMSFSEVALEAGFYDQAHFAKEFKKIYGITPGQYRDK